MDEKYVTRIIERASIMNAEIPTRCHPERSRGIFDFTALLKKIHEDEDSSATLGMTQVLKGYFCRMPHDILMLLHS